MNTIVKNFWYALFGFMVAMTFFCSTPAWAADCESPDLVQNAQWKYNPTDRTLKLCQRIFEGQKKHLRCTKFPGKVHVDGSFGYTENPFNLN